MMLNAERKEEQVNILTAVRVRPFNSREKDLNTQNIIAVSDKSLTLTDPEKNDDRLYTFDFCHWSHDGFKVTEEGEVVPGSPGSLFAGQEAVFQDIGIPAMNKAFEGYNVAIMAYGQTGSGKSYTMFGNKCNQGLVHHCFNYLFSELKNNPEIKYKVTFSLLEVYNEHVVDLLSKTTQALKIRERRNTGIHVENLTVVQTKSASQLEELLALGIMNRSISATKMNAVSSRSHLFLTLDFHQFIVRENGQRIKRKSRIRFVDPAGSERSTKTGATGDSLREATMINKSISALGNVINALANAKPGKPSFVPYRETKLTYLLKAELGGNCFFTLIANISPASYNYFETNVTLRLTNRAKMVVQKPTVNDLNVDQAIKTWKQDIEKTQTEIASATSEEIKAELQKSLETLQVGIQKLELPWKERKDTKEKEGLWWSSLLNLHKSDYESTPFLQNVSDDAVLSGVVKHLLPEGHNLLGSWTDKVNIELSGLGIQSWHAIVVNTGSYLTIAPYNRRASVHVNGAPITTTTKLNHLDHIKLGANELFVLVGLPSSRSTGESPNGPKHSYEMFMTELAQKHPLYPQLQPAGTVRQQTAAQVLLNEFTNILPMVAQANSMAAAFGKNMDFKMTICQGQRYNKQISVTVIDKDLTREWVWSKMKFEARYSEMDDLHSELLSSGQKPQLGKNNPFCDEENIDTCIGSTTVSLHNITYMLPVEDEIPIKNDNGDEVGSLSVSMTPCSSDGTPFQAPAEGTVLPDPGKLIGKELNLSLTISAFQNIAWVAGHKQRGFYCKMWIEGKKDVLKTETVFGAVNGHFQNKFQFSFENVTESLLEFLQTQGLCLQLWGTQAPLSSSTSAPVTSSSAVDQTPNSTAGQASKGSTDKEGNGGLVLDLNLAQDLRQFFRDVGPVGQKLKNLKTQVDENSRAQEVRLQSWADCSTQLKAAEEQLHTCVSALRESVKSALQRSKRND